MKKDERRALALKRAPDGVMAHDDTAVVEKRSRAAQAILHMNKRLLALLVAVCVVVPSLVLAGLHVLATQVVEDGHRRFANELVTSKTVSETPNTDGTYDVRLEAYTTEDMIEYTPTDIVLVLDLSGSMTKELRKDEYVNLTTHTTFSEHKFSDATSLFDTGTTFHDLYDNGNPRNNPDVSNSSIASYFLNVGVDHTRNKYIEDPNTPGIKVYLACRFKYDITHTTSISTWPYTKATHFGYQFFFTDSLGNEYQTEMNWCGGPADHVSKLDFTCVSASEGNENFLGDEVSIDSYWSRNEDTLLKDNFFDDATNETLWNYRDNLWIKDDYGKWCQVELTRDPDNSSATKYIYTFEDSEHNWHTTVQGNEEYGSAYGVFQGFKSYRYLTDDNGEFLLDANGKKQLEVIHSYEADPSDDNYSVESKSLYYKLSSPTNSVSRLQAMKEAVEQFIIDVHSNAHARNIEQRIAIVTFNNGATTKVELTDVRDEVKMNSIIDKLYLFDAENATQIDEGMEDAYDILSTQSIDRNKVTIAFTDGVPTDWGGSSYSVNAATRAISWAKQIKDLETAELISRVYAISLFDGADSNQMHGSMFYHSGVFHDNQICHGEEGDTWGRSNISALGNKDMSDVDAAATNRYLNLLSSNYEGATNVGIRQLLKLLEAYGGEGYMITKNFERTGDDYYFGSQSSTDLYQGFKKIAEEVSIPETTLGPKTTLVDTIADSFQLVGEVSAYTVPYIGNNKDGHEDQSNWDWNDQAKESIENAVSISQDGKTITLGGNENTGFDYSSNYVSAPNLNDALNKGKKVVVDFKIKPINNFVGGNNVPTNGTDSAIYGSDGIMVEDFLVPERDIPINYTLNTFDQDIYLTQETDLRNLYEVPNYLDGKTNEYVDITYYVKDGNDVVFTYLIPAGEESGLYGKSEDDIFDLFPNNYIDNKKYTVECVVTPIEEKDNGVQEETFTDNATVYVYKPVIYEKDDQKTISEGEAGVNLTPTVAWQLSGTEAPSKPTETEEVAYYINANDGSLVKASTYQGTGDELVYALDENDERVYATKSASLQVCTTAKESVNNSDVWVSRYDGAPAITFRIQNTDAPENATPVNAYVMTQTTNFQVVDVTVHVDSTLQNSQKTYQSPIATEVAYYVNKNTNELIRVSGFNGDYNDLVVEVDEEGNELTYTEDNVTYKVYRIVTQTENLTRTEYDVTDSNEAPRDFTYINTTSTHKTNANEGRFTIEIIFNLYINKEFSGDYATEEPIQFVFTANGEDPIIVNATENDFDHLKTKKDNSGKYVLSAPLKFGTTYTVTETFDTSGMTTEEKEAFLSSKDLQYATTFSGIAGGTQATPTAATNGSAATMINESYTFTVSQLPADNSDVVLIVDNNDTTVIPITGVGETDSKLNPFFIAAAVIALLGGSGTAYAVKRKKETAE